MMKPYFKKITFSFLLIVYFFLTFSVYAQTVNIDASRLLPHTEISFSPRGGSFEEGSTFQIPILLNTKGRNINGIEVRINFDKNKLSIVNPTTGTSIIGVWIEPPKYNNTEGTASYVGVIPDGITTGAGLIGTITFKAIAPGAAVISVSSHSKVLLNDGLGTETILNPGRAEYIVFPKAPEGVSVFSETHPVQSNWYNNNTPIVSWTKDSGVSGFSFILDNKPFTVPDNTIDSEDTTKTFDTLSDGLWYFHIKAVKAGSWGSTGHFLMRIDTAPPAEFKPEINYLVAAVISSERTLVSFFTTDNLSGVDHYEVGVINKTGSITESPVFVQAESPFQVPLNSGDKLQVVVRAIDKAGNVRDESIDAQTPFAITKFIENYKIYILVGIIFLGFIILIFHYLFGHHIVRSIRRLRKIIKKEKEEEEKAMPEKVSPSKYDNFPKIFDAKSSVSQVSNIPIKPNDEGYGE